MYRYDIRLVLDYTINMTVNGGNLMNKTRSAQDFAFSRVNIHKLATCSFLGVRGEFILWLAFVFDFSCSS